MRVHSVFAAPMIRTMRARLLVPCLVLAFAVPAGGGADDVEHDPCLTLIANAGFPTRELAGLPWQPALSEACRLTLEEIPAEPPPSRLNDPSRPHEELAWWSAYDDALHRIFVADPDRDARSIVRHAQWSILRAALEMPPTRRRMRYGRLSDGVRTFHASEVEESTRVLGAALRVLSSCVVHASAARFTAVARTCERIARAEIEPRRAWFMTQSPVSSRTRAWRCGGYFSLPEETPRPSPSSPPPRTSLLVVRDHALDAPLPVDDLGIERILSAVRTRIAEVTHIAVVDDDTSRAIEADARRGLAHGLPACSRPLTTDEAYADAAPTSAIVKVTLRCERQNCAIDVDMADARMAFELWHHVQRPTIAIRGRVAHVQSWVRAVSSSPTSTFVMSGRDPGGDVGAVHMRLIGLHRAGRVVDLVTDTRFPDGRVFSDEAPLRLIDALSACDGARTDIPDGVQTTVRLTVDGRGALTAVHVDSDDAARARCAERAFDGFATRCPIRRDVATIAVRVCSYHGEGP